MAIELESSVRITATPEQAYDYATDPDNWCEWYPHTSRIDRASRGPATAGSTWTEHLTVAGLPLRIGWRAIVAERPTRWQIRGDVRGSRLLRPLVHGATVEIVYTLEQASDATIFHRSIRYE